jgi:hypothetical protein
MHRWVLPVPVSPGLQQAASQTCTLCVYAQRQRPLEASVAGKG